MSHHHRHKHHHHNHHYGILLGTALYGTTQVGRSTSERLPAEPEVEPFPGDEPRPMQLQREAAKIRAAGEIAAKRPTIKPLDFGQRSANELRPMTFEGMVGQPQLKGLMSRIVARARVSNRPLEHMLLIGSAGTGKTTTAQIVAHELGTSVYQFQAPINQDVLEELAKVARPRDVVIVDECHLWVKPDRRGTTVVASPEQAYSILEDQVLQTKTGVLPFPAVTFIGCTTDTGLLPEPFLARFPLQPRLEPYSVADMIELAVDNARALTLAIDPRAASLFAGAARGTPRVVNRYLRNARALSDQQIDSSLAVEIITKLNSTTLDGLDLDMQRMLTFLLKSRRESRSGEVSFQAGVNSIATALGKSRDSRAISLYTEPYLIAQGYVQVTHGGRALTLAGAERAVELLQGGPQ